MTLLDVRVQIGVGVHGCPAVLARVQPFPGVDGTMFLEIDCSLEPLSAELAFEFFFHMHYLLVTPQRSRVGVVLMTDVACVHLVRFEVRITLMFLQTALSLEPLVTNVTLQHRMHFDALMFLDVPLEACLIEEFLSAGVAN